MEAFIDIISIIFLLAAVVALVIVFVLRYTLVSRLERYLVSNDLTCSMGQFGFSGVVEIMLLAGVPGRTKQMKRIVRERYSDVDPREFASSLERILAATFLSSLFLIVFIGVVLVPTLDWLGYSISE